MLKAATKDCSRSLKMNNTIMHFCLEAKDDNNHPLYLIYKVNCKELLWFYEPPPSAFTLVAKIRDGVPSMGCGVFGSKIVLAGGIGKRKNKQSCRYKGVITCDVNTHVVSKEDIPSMRGCKVSPVVCQVQNKLVAFDTYYRPHARSFEIYYPNQNIWHNLRVPYYTQYPDEVRRFSWSGGISRYSWFRFGDCFYVSLAKDGIGYVHHAMNRLNSFNTAFLESFPFRGMATTYYQEGFDDVVVISFSNGLVEGRRLCLPRHFSKSPVLILDTTKLSGYRKDMSGYFADLGHGNFCFTAFDKKFIHFHVFRILRLPCESGEDLNLQVKKSTLHKYSYEDFSGEGYQSFKFSGCFAPLSNDTSKVKAKAEAALQSRYFSCWAKGEEIDVPGVQLNRSSDFEETDSDYIGESDYDYSHFNASHFNA